MGESASVQNVCGSNGGGHERLLTGAEHESGGGVGDGDVDGAGNREGNGLRACQRDAPGREGVLGGESSGHRVDTEMGSMCADLVSVARVTNYKRRVEDPCAPFRGLPSCNFVLLEDDVCGELHWYRDVILR